MKININFSLLSISLLSFLRCANGFGIGLAIPLFYYGKLEEGLIGFIAAATALSYLFSPLLFRNTYKKIGMKMCLVIASIGFVIVQIGLQFFIDVPIMAYFFLFLDGLVLGLFWPVITGVLTVVVSQDNDELKEKKRNRNFGISWNLGGLFGYLLSAFALFIVSDILLVFDLSLIYTIIGLIVSLSFKVPKTDFGKLQILDETGSNLNSGSNWKFPIIIPLLMATLFALVSGGFSVLYPIKTKLLAFGDFSAYVVSFVRMLFQITCISWAMVMPIRTLKKVIPILMVMAIISLFILGITVDLFICLVIVAILGIFYGFIHSFGFRLTINKNLKSNDMKATTYFETAMGFFFWVSPIMAGFLADISIVLGFFTLAIILLVAVIFFILIQKKIEFD